MIAMTIIGCGKAKASVPSRADQLYTGSLFRAHLRLAERLGAGEVFILSALHGLVERDRVIEPYERRLDDLTDEQRRAWAASVAAAIERRVVEGGFVTVIAGSDYLSLWPSMIGKRLVVVPFAGRSMGERIGAAVRAAVTPPGPLLLEARVLVPGEGP